MYYIKLPNIGTSLVQPICKKTFECFLMNLVYYINKVIYIFFPILPTIFLGGGGDLNFAEIVISVQ